MGKRVLIISTSPRAGSNSEFLASEFARGAAEAEDDNHVWERARSGLEGWIECFPKARLAGCVFGGNVTEVKSVAGHPAMEEAYEMGKKI